MEEYHDCLQRARRLAVACEATLAGSDSAMSVVTVEDLLIYTRWFICMLHSVKRINAFIRVSWSGLPWDNWGLCSKAARSWILNMENVFDITKHATAL